MIFKFSPTCDILIVFMTRWIILYLWVWVLFNIPLKLLLIISVVFDLSPLPECPLVMGQERVFLFTARSSGSSGQIVKSLVC